MVTVTNMVKLLRYENLGRVYFNELCHVSEACVFHI